MRNFILSAAIAVAAIAGSLAWTDTADARPWRYYRAPAVRYYRPYYGYRPYYYQSYYYGPRAYVGYRYPGYYYGPYYGGGVYFRW